MRICELFLSIQGEGLMMGVPTFFIRSVGCNLSCSWCDTGYSMSGGEEMSVEEIMRQVGDCGHVCVTGGEPMLQPDIADLLDALVRAGKHTVLETNGATDLSKVPDDRLVMISMDIKCPSSGMTDRMLLSNLAYLSGKDQLKFVIADDRDFDFAVGFLRDNEVKANVVFTPVGGVDRLEWLVSRVLESKADVRVLPQLHKVIWGDRRAVRPRSSVFLEGPSALEPSHEVLDAVLHGAVLVRRHLDSRLLKDFYSVHPDPSGEDRLDVPEGDYGFSHSHSRAGKRILELVHYDAVVQGVRVDQQEEGGVAEVVGHIGVQGLPFGYRQKHHR